MSASAATQPAATGWERTLADARGDDQTSEGFSPLRPNWCVLKCAPESPTIGNQHYVQMWHRHFASNKQIEAIFGSEPPPLDSVVICELLFRSPEQMYFSANASAPLATLPEKWAAAGMTELQLRFRLSLIGAPSMRGLLLASTECQVIFSEQSFAIRALDDSWSLSGNAFLDSIHVVAHEPQGPGHSVDWFPVRY